MSLLVCIAVTLLAGTVSMFITGVPFWGYLVVIVIAVAWFSMKWLFMKMGV